MKNRIAIGTCGFSRAQAEYQQQLSCVEVQQTFYQPPQLATLERWRQQAPADFEFTLKAWQLITHEAKSPTYKRLKKTLSEAEKKEAGYFKDSPVVADAWNVTLACARALRAKTILFQCPASFTQTRAHIARLERFFSGIDRADFNLGWEPRGDWDKNEVKAICENLKLWHVVDPFAEATMTPELCYFRLHGRQGWRYKYEAHELAELVELVPSTTRSYIFFNNIFMMEDALLFKKIVETETQ